LHFIKIPSAYMSYHFESSCELQDIF